MRRASDTPGDPWDQVRVHYVGPDGRKRQLTVDQAADTPFEEALLVRPIRNRPGQRNTIAYYWCATTGRHVECESYLESCWLGIFDFDPTVTAMAAQPFRLTGLLDGRDIDHVPDFFLRQAGRSVVVDVRAKALQNDQHQRQVDVTRRFCDRAGFEYQVLSEPDRQRWANIRFLAGFRYAPQIGLDSVERIVQRAVVPRPFGALTEHLTEDPSLVRGIVLHLCWTQRLRFDLSKPLRDDTLVVAAEAT